MGYVIQFLGHQRVSSGEVTVYLIFEEGRGNVQARLGIENRN